MKPKLFYLLFLYSHLQESVPHIFPPALITDYIMQYLVHHLAFFKTLMGSSIGITDAD